MNEKNLAVLTNIIGAVETGGQVYGKRRYNDYTAPYTNSEKEVTCTLGWYQAYGHEAQQLIREIYEADRNEFWHIDNAGIAEMLDLDWVAIRWNPDKKERAALVALIDSPIGHEVQDRIFSEKMKKLIAECGKDYTEDIKAQMMYCEIRHLGGKGPADRIFKRCAGDYSLERIMQALAQDQRDLTSGNQVGDTKYWSRHVKCREFIEKYADDESAPAKEEKEEKKMAVIIGSARGDENGNARGGKAGDQKQTGTPDYKGEVSRQEWYKHSKGWFVFRAKDPAAREEIAKNTEEACDNVNVGYDQGENRTLLAEAKKVGLKAKDVKTKCETDCGQLQRLGILRAGIDISDFYTANMKAAVEKTGKFYVFTDAAHCNYSTRLIRGDILCTRTKGHTVCVLTDGARAAEERAKYDGTPEPEPAPAGRTCADAVKDLQNFMNGNYEKIIGKKLKTDGVYGTKTRAAAVAVWKYMANKYYNAGLTVGNENFFQSSRLASAKMTDAEVAKHPTLGIIIQGVLAGKGYYTAKLDGICGAKTQAAVKKLQKAGKIPEDGSMDPDTWFMLFN